MKTVHLAAQSDPDSFEGPRVGGAYDPPERGWATADAPVTFAFGGAVGASGRPGWASFVEAVGLQHLRDDPRFDKNGRSTTGLGPKARELKGEYEKRFRQMPASEVVAQVRRFGGFASAYLTHRQLLAEPQAHTAEIVVDAGGPADILDFPARFSDSRPKPKRTLSALGQHNDEIAKQLGLRPVKARAG
jgi:crotonobetainyl-CoA:carnitine CoA-transferase CaiB-like acyl-CoA transferase